MSKRRLDYRSPGTRRQPFNPTPILAALALLALALVAFAPAIGGQYIWDDDDYVHHNPNLRHAAGLADIWLRPTHNPQYYPLVFTTFWVEWRLWGDNPAGYRVVNILLHAASAILLWRSLHRLQLPGAYLAAAIFAVHPVMAESVAWITERKNTLSLLLYLAAAHTYLRFAQLGTGNLELAPQNRNWKLYALSLLFFTLALLSKTVTATLPAAIMLILWWKRGRFEWRHAALLAPFFVLGVAAGLHTGHLERTHVGATGPEWDWSFAQRSLIASRAVWFYAAKLLVPVNLSFIYPKWTIDPARWWQWLFTLSLLITLASLFALRPRIGRAPLVAALFFIGTLFPALGFVNVFPMQYSFVADHFQYHASIGLIALVAAGLTLAANRYVRPGLASSRNARIAAAVLILGLTILTMRRAYVLASPDRLWNDTIAKNPDSWMAWTNLAHLAEARNDHKTAADAYRKAYDLAPDHVDTRYNLALLRAREGQTEQAIADLEQIINQHPRHANARQQLARIYRNQKRYQHAIQHLEAALQTQPNNPDYRFDLALAHRDAGQPDRAIADLEQLLQSHPNHPSALRELANLHIAKKDYPKAENPLRALVAMNPQSADDLFDLATVLVLTKRQDEAMPLYDRALRLKPELRDRLPR